MRLAGQRKMGYYPTPVTVVDRIGAWLDYPGAPFAALDPCAGEGAALARCLDGTQGIGHGIELDGQRARIARGVLPRVLCCDAGRAKVAKDAFGLLWLNPPYDDSDVAGGRSERQELRFLRLSTRHLVPGGVLVFIIPLRLVGDDVAEYLATHYERVRLWRFPYPEWYGFKQCVVLAQQKPKPFEDPAVQVMLQKAAEAARAADYMGPKEVPDLTEPGPGDARYGVPAGNADVQPFEAGALTLAAIEAAVGESALESQLSLRLGVGGSRLAGRPPVTLRKGHLALLLAAGEVDGLVGSGRLRHVVRGSTVKEVIEEDRSDEIVNAKGEYRHRTRTFEVDRFRMRVMALDARGNVHRL